jgi:hypothetical protein
MDVDDSGRSARAGVAEMARSARGWHGVQLGVLALIGLCGVLTENDPDHPRWLQIGAGLAALLALGLACLAVFLVASVAWPFPTGTADVDDVGAAAAVGAKAAAEPRRLHTGVALTYAAMITMAIAASASWWPDADSATDGEGGAGVTVEVTAHDGSTACGQLLGAPTGTIRLATASRAVELATSGLAAISPTDSC